MHEYPSLPAPFSLPLALGTIGQRLCTSVGADKLSASLQREASRHYQRMRSKSSSTSIFGRLGKAAGKFGLVRPRQSQDGRRAGSSDLRDDHEAITSIEHHVSSVLDEAYALPSRDSLRDLDEDRQVTTC